MVLAEVEQEWQEMAQMPLEQQAAQADLAAAVVVVEPLAVVA
jgi:hypothetical protein